MTCDIKLKAKQSSYIDVTIDKQELLEAVCKIIREKHHLPEGCWIDTVSKKLMADYGDGRMPDRVVRLSGFDDYAAIELMKTIMGYAK